MCQQCVKKPLPNRGATCLEAGVYMANYGGCHQCQSVDMPLVQNKESEVDEDGEETITYSHVCASCGHVVAKHEYTFGVDEDEEFQEYMMTCVLCGRGAASVSVMPYDPREQRFF
eukprot:m.121958 g.121958  ORF g.121958 m.121958 type:complete len:115 (+) comp16545_c1_seq3:120-464(+)